MVVTKKRGEATVALGSGKSGKGDDEKALSPIYRNIGAEKEWPSIEGVTTLYELFEKSVRQFPEARCLGWRPIEDGKAGPYEYITYKQVQDKAGVVASAIRAAGVGVQGKVGVYSPNRIEWQLVIQACNSAGLVLVPLYDSLGEEAVEYTVNHSSTSLVFLDASKFAPMAKSIPKVKDNVKTVVFWGEAKGGEAAAIEKQGVKVIAWDDFMRMGEEKAVEPRPPKPDDPATIMYTSGTTGNPKGVILTHKNILSTIAGIHLFVSQAGIEYDNSDNMLSYLTLAHIFGRAAEEFALSCGAAIGYWQGDVKKLTDDVAALQPSLFVAVPRVLERIQSGIVAKLKKKSWLVRFVFNLAYKWKLSRIRGGSPVPKATPLLDRLLFKTFKQAFGGRVRFIVSGGAPLATHVEQFLAVTLCSPVFQGYGLTETCGASFLALPSPGHGGTVGPPTGALELRFEGSEELGYDPNAEPPRGEVCVRGPQVFPGYYQDEEKTKEAFDKDGFFHTGDVGELTEAGCLKIIDRMKNMFKLAQGEYIAAEKLENVYSEAEVVEQIWVYGNSYESFLVAIVVPNARALKAWASSAGVSSSDVKEICRSPEAEKYVVEELGKAGKARGLRGFERIKCVHLDPEEWTVDNGTVTPSFKLKRPQLQKRYQKQIDDMYNKNRGG